MTTALEALQVPTLLQGNTKCMSRLGSFTDVEKICLRALFLDNNDIQKTDTSSPSLSSEEGQTLLPKTILNDTALFQVPFPPFENSPSDYKFGRHANKIMGLWKAHQDGAHPVIMEHRRKPKHGDTRYSNCNNLPPNRFCQEELGHSAPPTSKSQTSMAPSSSGGALSINSDAEVRPGLDHDDHSSWPEEDGGFVHYDAWEVLKDEYAEEFGFDFQENASSVEATLANEDEDCMAHVFKILGTSADDTTSQPHVLSPPIMDSLLSFVPDSLSMENYWMKFSLIRDGASLYTLKQYVKAAPYTILAIETTKGQVFGAFTSHIWRNHPTFYGSAPAFLWRMRHNRRTPCHSLFEQAQLESEIDVYAFSGLNDLVQVCDDYRIAIGGGKLISDLDMVDPLLNPTDPNAFNLENLDAGQNFGFGIALDENLRRGTTSPCGTFRNACLTDHMSKGEVFECANIEVWTFTPCADVKSAERLEMTRYFVEESMRTVPSSQSSAKLGFTADVKCNSFKTQEEFQKEFYRRVG